MKATQAKEVTYDLPKAQLCVVCNKLLQAPYGRHNSPSGVVWTCSGKCERLYVSYKKGV